MARRVLSIVFYVVAGFFVYTVTLLSFIDMDSLPSVDRPPAWTKFAIMGGFAVPAAIAMLIGLGLSRFQHWKRDVGIVLVSGAGITAFAAVTLICLLLSPGFQELFPAHNMTLFDDVATGASCTVAAALIGVVCIRISKKAK